MPIENKSQTADYRRARAEARRVLRTNNILRPPVVPREIAESYGLSVELIDLPAEMKQVAGLIDFGENGIFVNSADHYNRQTFTIAHELGHYLMHRELFEKHPEQYKVLMRRPIAAETDPIEQEANAFAADLLVPMDMLRLYKKYATEDDLAKLFAVSPEVIRYRLKFAGTPSLPDEVLHGAARRSRANLEDSEQQSQRQSAAVEHHLRGLDEFYRSRDRWSRFLIACVAVSLVFQVALTVAVGLKWLDYTQYRWFLPIVVSENFIQIVGLATIVLKWLFSGSVPRMDV